MSRPKKHPQKPAEAKTKAGKGNRGRKRKGMCLEDRPILEVNAAGIDIGAREIFVAVPPDRDEHPVRVTGIRASPCAAPARFSCRAR